VDEINAAVIPDIYPVPSQAEIIAELADYKDVGKQDRTRDVLKRKRTTEVDVKEDWASTACR
jgi:hypothetical protein